jgi:hypothetical protein
MVKMSEQGISNLASALAKFQGEVKNPSNTAKNPQFKSKYAPLDEVINTVKPILESNGLSFIQSTGSYGENVVITTLLMHESGEWLESDPLTLPAYQLKSGGVKDFNAQGAGSAITYGRRYSLSAILGLSSEDDDDGNNASGYKDSSSNAPSNNNKASEEAKEKARQEALAKAQARKANNTPTQTNDSPSESAEKISPAQMKAIENLVKIVSRAKGFDEGEYLSNLVAVHGAPELAELTQEQAKAVISQINNDRNNK